MRIRRVVENVLLMLVVLYIMATCVLVGYVTSKVVSGEEPPSIRKPDSILHLRTQAEGLARFSEADENGETEHE